MHTVNGKWNVEYTDEFETWWSGLADAERLFADHLAELEKEYGGQK